MTVKVSEEKCVKMREACKYLKSKKCFTIREVAKAQGLTITYTSGVENGLLELEACKNWALKQNKFDYKQNNDTFKGSVGRCHIWWEHNIESACTYRLKPAVSIVTATDSSTKAWGAIRDRVSTGSYWTLEEQGQHINVLELFKAIELGLKSLCHEV